MFPFPIIHKTCGIPVFHLIVERTNISPLIHPISHLTFRETQRVKFISFLIPLFVIHHIMRISLFIILNFLIMVVMIFSFIHLITILIRLMLIFLSHQFFYNQYFDEGETPQAVEALQPELMVMSCSRSLEISSTSDKKSVESPQTPHHSLVHIENQSNSQFLYPPLESHDPFAHVLEESYMTSTATK